MGTIVTNNTIYGTSSSNVYAGQAIEIWNAGASTFPTRDLVVANNLLVMTTGQDVSGSCSIPMPTNVVDYT
jgi:hypothetical protein